MDINEFISHIKQSVASGIPITQFVSNPSPPAQQMKQAGSDFLSLLGVAGKTGINAVAGQDVLPMISQEQERFGGNSAQRMGKGGLATLNAVLAAATPQIAASNPASYLAASYVPSAAMQTGGAIIRDTQQKRTNELGGDILHSLAGQGPVPGPFTAVNDTSTNRMVDTGVTMLASLLLQRAMNKPKTWVDKNGNIHGEGQRYIEKQKELTNTSGEPMSKEPPIINEPEINKNAQYGSQDIEQMGGKTKIPQPSTGGEPLYHGTNQSIQGGALDYGKKLGTSDSGGIFLTDNKNIAKVFGDTVYTASPEIKGKVLDLTTPEVIGLFKRQIGKTYTTFAGEKMPFTQQDFDLMFPNGKTDFASVSQYPELVQKVVNQQKKIGIAFNEYAGGQIGKTYQILNGKVPVALQGSGGEIGKGMGKEADLLKNLLKAKLTGK